jgi:hypothetical protein
MGKNEQKERDETLRRMLKTPPKPRTPNPPRDCTDPPEGGDEGDGELTKS